MKSSFFDFKVFLTPVEEISVSGQHQKRLTIVSNYSDDTPAQLDFLRKILSAAKFDLATDAALVQLKEKQHWQFSGHQKRFRPSHCLSFGIAPQRMGLQFNVNYYQPVTYAGCTFLFAHPLVELQENVNYKGALWNCLQQLFLLNN